MKPSISIADDINPGILVQFKLCGMTIDLNFSRPVFDVTFCPNIP